MGTDVSRLKSQVDITTIFVSEVQWQSIRPSLRASPEPYYIDVPHLSKQGEPHRTRAYNANTDIFLSHH